MPLYFEKRDSADTICKTTYIICLLYASRPTNINLQINNRYILAF